MKFFLDQDVDARVVSLLVRRGHAAWTAADAGLSEADDDLTVYASERGAAVVTHDREFSQRRQRNTIGRHIWLHCPEPDAHEVLEAHLDALVELLTPFEDCFVHLSRDGLTLHIDWT